MERPDGHADAVPSAANGACVDAGLGAPGSANVRGTTPLGTFTAMGSHAIGQCLWLQFVSADARGCARQVLTAATGLRVPPLFEGSRLAVGISMAVDGQSSPHVASGYLSIDTVTEGSGPPVLKGSLVVQQPDWSLEGTFEAPWIDLPCK